MSDPTSSETSLPIFIVLGSNIEPEANLPRAVTLLAEHVRIAGVSRVYETAPITAQGGVDAKQAAFLNAAVLIETSLEPVPLKYEVLRAIEAQMGRQRTEDKFAPRPIDLDIALYDDLLLHLDSEETQITIPDPDILARAHVALPLADLAPGFVHPTTGETLRQIADQFEGHDHIRVRADVTLPRPG